VPQDKVVENAGPLVQAASSMANVRSLAQEYATARKARFRETFRKHADASLKVQKLAECGDAVAGSDVGCAFFYEKLERSVRKKHQDMEDAAQKVVINDAPLTVDLAQLDPKVAWAILEDELMS
jgi:hypothetical protein